MSVYDDHAGDLGDDPDAGGPDGFGVCDECGAEDELDDGVCEGCWDDAGADDDYGACPLDEEDGAVVDDLEDDGDGWAAAGDDDEAIEF